MSDHLDYHDYLDYQDHLAMANWLKEERCGMVPDPPLTLEEYLEVRGTPEYHQALRFNDRILTPVEIAEYRAREA